MVCVLRDFALPSIQQLCSFLSNYKTNEFYFGKYRKGRRKMELYANIMLKGASLVAQMVKNQSSMQETWVCSVGREDALEKGRATHSSILTWKIPWTEEPGRLQSMWLQRVRPDWETNTFTFNAKWQKHLPLQALPSVMEIIVQKLSGWCQGICSHTWWLSALHGLMKEEVEREKIK